MVESILGGHAEQALKIVVLVPSEEQDWLKVQDFCNSALPGLKIQVLAKRDIGGEECEGAGFVFMVNPNEQMDENSFKEKILENGGFLNVIEGESSEISPWQVAKRVAKEVGSPLSDEGLGELELLVWPVGERGGVADSRNPVILRGEEEPELGIPVGMLTTIQESVVIRKPTSKGSGGPVGTARVFHPSRVPRTEPKLQTREDSGRVVLNTGLEKPIGAQALRVHRKNFFSSPLFVSADEGGLRARGKRVGLEKDLKERKKRQKKKISWRGVALVMGSLLLLGLIAIFGGVGRAWSLRDRFEETVHEGSRFFAHTNRGGVENFFQNLEKSKVETQEWWGVVGPVLPFFGHSSGEVDELFVYAEKQVSALSSLKKLQKSSQALVSSVWQARSSQGVSLLPGVQVDGERALKSLAEFGLELQRKKDDAEIEKGRGAESLLGLLRNERKLLSSDQRLLSILGEVTGEKKKKIYAVLVHDSSELRAPHGAMSGMVLLQFERGHLVGYQAINPFLLDDSMLASIQPPDELKRVLGVETWAFTQSNWDPDFSVSSKQMKWFLEKQLKVRLDGVISMNDESLGKMLVALNGVEMVSEGFVGESDVRRLLKKEDLGRGVVSTELISAVLKKMETAPPEQLQELFYQLGADARAGRVVFHVSDPVVEKGFQSLGWTGDILSPDCPVQVGEGRCLVDTLYAVDSHLGETSSLLVEKRMDHTVFLSSASAEHRVVLWYQNNAPANLPKGRGEFQNYLRIYTPEKTGNFLVKIGEGELSGEGVESVVEEGRRKTTFTFNVPAGVRLPVEIRYTTPLEKELPLAYALFMQRQPGVDDYPVSLVVNIEKSLSAKTVAPAADVVENVVAYDLSMNEHQFVAVEVARRE